MDTQKFEEMLGAGEALAEAFRGYKVACEGLEAARQRLQDAQGHLEDAERLHKSAAQAYEDAKFALIGSVEAL